MGGGAVGIAAFGGVGLGWQAGGGIAIAWDVACGGLGVAWHAAYGGLAIAHEQAVDGRAVYLLATSDAAWAGASGRPLRAAIAWYAANLFWIAPTAALTALLSCGAALLMYRREPAK